MRAGQRARVPFGRPFPRRVDAHLAAVRRQIRGIVQIVDRPLGHLDVAQRIDVGADDPRHLAEVVHVDVLVDDDDRLREHQLTEAPERVHDLARVPGIALVDRHDHEVVEDALGRKVHVDDLGQRLADHRQENALARQPEVVVLHRRHADDRREIGRPLPPRDAGEVEHRVVVGLRIEAGVIAERPFAAPLARLDVALEHDVRARRHLEIDASRT